MKKLAALIACALSLALCTAQRQKNDINELVSAIMTCCPGYDSLHVAATVQRLHTLYKVRVVKIRKSATGSNHFVFWGRKMLLNNAAPARMYDMWVAELTHALSYNANPVGTWLRFTRDVFKTLFEFPFLLNKSERRQIRYLRSTGCPRLKAMAWVAWKRRYADPHSIENVHEKYEPILFDLIPKSFSGAL